MRRHTIYSTFQRRWQLPVYFQLRWKDIVGKLEDALSPKSDATNVPTKGGCSFVLFGYRPAELAISRQSTVRLHDFSGSCRV